MNINDFLKNPDLFLLALEPQRGVFVQMDRGAYEQSIFCDMRIKPKAQQAVNVPLDQLMALSNQHFKAPPSLHYIFHVAHCGSTLLARALELKADNLVCREPLVLRQLGVEFSAKGAQSDQLHQQKMKLATGMLSRRYNPDGPVIVKANVPVNFIAPELMALNANQKAIVLYFPFEYYLLAIMRSPNHKKWVANIVNEMQHALKKWAPLEANMTIAQAAGSLWLAQMRIYAQLQATYPGVASLNAEDLFETPAAAVGAAFNHFGQPQGEAAIQSIVESELFARYSKNPTVAFDNSSRLARREEQKQALKSEISEARAWVEKALEKNPLPERFSKSLVGEGAPLMMHA